MDLSLDDIIRSKKNSSAPSKKFIPKQTLPLRKTLNRPVFKEAQRITDARFKIIQNNRAKIVDARDKLAEITRANGDARKKLLMKQQLSNSTQRNGKHNSYRNGHNGHVSAPVKTRKLSSGPGLKSKSSQQHQQQQQQNYRTSGGMIKRSAGLPDLVDVPRGYVDYDNMERMEEEEYAASTRLSRTVTNDIAPYDTYGVSRPEHLASGPRRLNSWGSSSETFDPFNIYEVPHSAAERRVSRDLSPPPPKGILRPSMRQHSPDDLYQRRYIPETTSHLSYEMRSRLERAPDPHASMGIFANPLKPSPTAQISGSGYRIVVSNLHTSVTQSDIKELFEDIGELYDSRIVRPGIAEVIYSSLSDAEKAVDTYHNRQLDGQPMKCLLVNPRASNKPTAPAINTTSSSSRHNLGKTPLEIDIDALHKVLFRRH